MKILTFYIEDQPYAIPIGVIREIIENANITEVGRAYEDIYGLMNVRGQIVTVLLPGISLGHTRVVHEDHRMIILKKENELSEAQRKDGMQNGTAKDYYAFVVDKVAEVHDVETQDLDPVPGNTPKDEARFISAIARINGGVLPIINVNQIINQEIQNEDRESA